MIASERGRETGRENTMGKLWEQVKRGQREGVSGGKETEKDEREREKEKEEDERK